MDNSNISFIIDNLNSVEAKNDLAKHKHEKLKTMVDMFLCLERSGSNDDFHEDINLKSNSNKGHGQNVYRKKKKKCAREHLIISGYMQIV